MARIPCLIAAAVLSLTVGGFSASAGVLARSTVFVDWSRATLALPSGASVALRASQSEASAVYYFTPFDKIEDPPTPGANDRSEDWGDTAFTASLAFGNVRAGASTSAAALAADAFVSLAGENQGGEALSRAMREARIRLTEAGSVSFSVPIRIDVLSRISQPGETADAIGLIDLFLVGLRADSPIAVDTARRDANGTEEGSDARTLVVAADFLAGDEIALQIEAIAWADGATLIATPSSLALLLAPLAMLRGTRRRVSRDRAAAGSTSPADDPDVPER